MARSEEQRLRNCPTCGGNPPEGWRDYSGWAYDLLPNQVGFSDLDAVLERRHDFLVLEFKAPGQTWMPTGQWRMLQALADKKPKTFTVRTVAQESEKSDLVVVRNLDGQGSSDIIITMEEFRRDIERWWER